MLKDINNRSLNYRFCKTKIKSFAAINTIYMDIPCVIILSIAESVTYAIRLSLSQR